MLFLFRFHTYNASRQSETMAAVSGNQVPEDALFARPPDQRTPRVNVHWLTSIHDHNLV